MPARYVYLSWGGIRCDSVPCVSPMLGVVVSKHVTHTARSTTRGWRACLDSMVRSSNEAILVSGALILRLRGFLSFCVGSHTRVYVHWWPPFLKSSLCGYDCMFRGLQPISAYKARLSVQGRQEKGTDYCKRLLVLFSPLPRRHGMWIGPQPYPGRSCLSREIGVIGAEAVHRVLDHP